MAVVGRFIPARAAAAMLLCVLVQNAVIAQPAAVQDGVVAPTQEQANADALRQATGAPARVELAGQATLRLAEDMVLIPPAPAKTMLSANNLPVPPDMLGLLMGAQRLELTAPVSFVPAGFIDADSILAWTPDDILASIDNTVRRRKTREPQEARRWIRPPRYDRDTHQLVWAALIVPVSASPESGGEVIYTAIAFGRQGYVKLAVSGSVEQADAAMQLITLFLNGLHFLPGLDYTDVVPSDARAPAGLAPVIGADSFRKASGGSGWFGSDLLIAVAGGLVALIGALWLGIYAMRYMRAEARRS